MNGLPSGVVDWLTSNLPTSRDVRYVACGCVLRQFQRVQPARFLLLLTSVPLDSAATSSGTSTETSKVARSVGWSFDGNHHAALCGSSTASAPSGVFFHPAIPSIFT